MIRSATLMSLVFFFVAACGSGNAGSRATEPTEAAPPLVVDQPQLDEVAQMTCDGRRAGAFDANADAASAEEALASAVKIATELPNAGYVAAKESDDVVVYLYFDGDELTAKAKVVRYGDGWAPDSWSSC